MKDAGIIASVVLAVILFFFFIGWVVNFADSMNNGPIRAKFIVGDTHYIVVNTNAKEVTKMEYDNLQVGDNVKRGPLFYKTEE